MMNDMPITVTQILVIWFVLMFAITVFAFIGKESKTGDYLDGFALSVFQGVLIGTVIMIPVAYCMLVLNINPFI